MILSLVFDSKQQWQEFFYVCSAPLSPQWHIKDPGHCAESASSGLLLNMHTVYTLNLHHDSVTSG